MKYLDMQWINMKKNFMITKKLKEWGHKYYLINFVSFLEVVQGRST
jgi:hypothetical protein